MLLDAFVACPTTKPTPSSFLSPSASAEPITLGTVTLFGSAPRLTFTVKILPGATIVSAFGSCDMTTFCATVSLKPCSSFNIRSVFLIISSTVRISLFVKSGAGNLFVPRLVLTLTLLPRGTSFSNGVSCSTIPPTGTTSSYIFSVSVTVIFILLATLLACSIVLPLKSGMIIVLFLPCKIK